MKHFNGGKCPVCKSKLNISKLSCPECKAEFPMDNPMLAFAYLDDEKNDFLMLYLKNRGNLKSLGQEINCSYPTAKKKLENLLVALGFESNENVIDVAEEIDMNLIRKPINKPQKASEIVRNKFISTTTYGKEIAVKTFRGETHILSLVDDGEHFYCPALKKYPFSIFDVIVDVMFENGGKAKKGSGRKKLGEPGCEEYTIAGALLKNYFGVKPGGSGLDPAFILVPVLEWAGIVKNEFGYAELTADFLDIYNK